MTVAMIDCAICGYHTDGWIQVENGRPLCFLCNERRVARLVLADEAATGRAAVRLLQRAMDAIHEGRPREVDCGYVFCDEATAVLATDTATAWLEEGQDGNG